MLSKNIFIVVSFLTVVFTSSTSAQQTDEILFGTYLPSSNFPEITYHRFNDSNLVKLGFNTILQTVMHRDIHKSLFDTVSNIWWDNRSDLANSTFDNIVAMNGNWNRADQSLQQVDWIKILTHGVYNNWEAEGGEGDFYSDQIKMERDTSHTDIFELDGIKGVKTRVPIDTMLIESERSLLRGPFMYQDQIYKVGFRYGNDTISYRAKFSMKIGHKPEQPLAVCTLKVKIIYPISDSTYSEKLLASLPLTTVSFNSENYSTFVLSYKIEGLPGNITDSPDISKDFKSASLNFMNTKVYYEVVLAPYCDPRNYRHLYIDNIEVVDVDIWERHGNQISTLLTSYNNLWKADDAGSVYEDKIKYFYTMDEPHSYDHFIPYREVEAVQKNIDPFMKDKLMLTKIYPEWDGYKEGLNVIDTWAEVVKPRKLMFWYYTIFNVQEGTYISQLQLRDRLREAANYDKDFFYTAQTFGTRKLQYMGVFPPLDSHYYKYRTPTGSQALGQSMLALAYGSKGIFYETYYSYISSAPGWGDYFAESLVGNNSDDFDRPRSNDYGLYDTIVSLGKRLKGPLGNLLPKLEFSEEESYIYNTWQRDRKQNSINPTKLKIFGEGIPEYPNNRFLNLGITRLQPKTSFNITGDYYFLLNQITFDNFALDPEVISTYNSLHVGINVSVFRNWRFYDIEGGDDFKFVKLNNHTGSDFTAIIPIGKGDGRLFRLIPTAASTGTFLTDEVITSGEIISSEGTITVPMGITLKIEGNYTLTDSLIIEDGGVLALEPGSTLNLDSASSVYCAGDLYINGTETNKVTINFLQPNESKQNSIYLGNGSSAIVKYAQIKNGYSGISALNGFDTLTIDNCTFTNITHAALLLNGNGYDNAKITNNTYTNCDYAGFFSNLATVAVNSDSANTTSGYYFSNVSNLWFGNNKLTGTQEGPGMTLTGCFGNIYNNKITDHTDGILLAHSFPKIGGNEITNNTQRGLVCEYGSGPDLRAFSEAGVCEQMNTYPLSGFNRISNNGTNAAEEGYEIFLDNSSIEMMNGTNEVSDPNYNPLILGKYMLERVDLSGNYWGTETITSEMFVLSDPFIYSPVLTGFAPVISIDCPFVISINSLSFTDTLHRINNGIIGTGGERAEGYMAEGEYDSAYTEFQSMSLITEDTTSINTEPLRGMYRSSKLGNNKETKLYLLTVKTDSLLSTVTDTNALKTLNRLKVYIEADNNNIPTAQLLASQNTTNAITITDQYHAQTEELTIALRGTTQNRNMKNDVGSITTMNKSGMNNLMKRHGNKFTIKKEPKPVEIITEYSLSQNYPNPFNSSTIIEYALPKEGLVSIKLFDITGRLIKQLVNEQKPMGRHKTTIDSGNLASGIYIYSLRVNDININKKLVILK